MTKRFNLIMCCVGGVKNLMNYYEEDILQHHVQVDKSNIGAIKLYKSLGFEITGTNGDMSVMTLDKTVDERSVKK